MTALLWTRDDPTRCACAGSYRPVLNANGKLVKTREPAWKMAEQTRDPGCLQEQCRDLSKFYRTGYQHHKSSKGSGSGYPDCHLWVRSRADGGGSAFIELKRMGKDPTDDQIRVMAELQDAGHLVYLARPCCLFTGALDEIFASLAGVRCRYLKGAPPGAKQQIFGPVADLADVLADIGEPPIRKRLGIVVPKLPGTDPGEPFDDAMGLIVPMPAGRAAAAAVNRLEAWLEAAGFPKADVPFPMRIVVGTDAVLVQVRVGLARAGKDERVWRRGAPADPFPTLSVLVDELRHDVVYGPSSQKVAWLIENAPHSSVV